MAVIDNVDTFEKLLAAINSINSNGQADEIRITQSIVLTSALPFIREDVSLTIRGIGEGITLSGDANGNGINDAGDVRIFFIESGQVTLENLVMF